MEKLQSKETIHATKRIRKRCGVSKRYYKLAIERGIPYTKYSGQFRRYLDLVRLKEGKFLQILVYSNKIYLFDKDILITVLDIPAKFHKYKSK